MTTTATHKPADADALRHTAGQLVAHTFFGTLMKSARETHLGSDKFTGGRGGQVFQQMLDDRLVGKMGAAVGGKLVDAIVHRLTRSSGAEADGRSGPATNIRKALKNQETRHVTDIRA